MGPCIFYHWDKKTTASWFKWKMVSQLLYEKCNFCQLSFFFFFLVYSLSSPTPQNNPEQYKILLSIFQTFSYRSSIR